MSDYQFVMQLLDFKKDVVIERNATLLINTNIVQAQFPLLHDTNYARLIIIASDGRKLIRESVELAVQKEVGRDLDIAVVDMIFYGNFNFEYDAMIVRENKLKESQYPEKTSLTNNLSSLVFDKTL